MMNLRFEAWIRRAVSLIVLPQDRVLAEMELMGHMEDRYQDNLERGVTPTEAERNTIDAMGDADDVAHRLGLIHLPFWTYCRMFSRRILLVTACLTLVCLFGRALAEFAFIDGYRQPTYFRYDPYRDTSVYDGASQLDRILYVQPNAAATSDGYTLTLTETALWHSTYTDIRGQAQEDDLFHFRLKVTNPLPWAASTDISRWFWAVDDLGNYYYAAYESSTADPSVQGSIYHTGPLTYLHDLYLTDYASQDAQWIELHYDRAGRDLVLRIDLTGGDSR